MRPSYLAGLMGSASVGGIALGAAGTGIYSGFRLAGGEDFTSLSVVKQHDPSGTLFPSHRRRGRRAINGGANDYYWTPDHTGYADGNRGVPCGVSDMVVQSGSSVLLKTRLATASEKAIDWDTTASTGPNRPQASSSIHSAGYQGVKWPCIVEARVKVPTPASGAAGMWPAFWLENMLPSWPTSGEWDFEWVDNGDLFPNFISTDGAGGAGNDGSIGATAIAHHVDGAFHTVTMIATATQLKFYVDGTLAATSAKTTNTIVNGPMFWWLRHGVDLTPGIYGMTYNAAAWAGKEPVMEVDWVRIWTEPTASDIGYKGVVQTVNVDFAGSFSVTLPTMSSLWGGTGYTEYLVAQPFEDMAPGMSQVPTTTNFDNWYGATPSGNYAGPSIFAWNKATRAFSGASFDRPGRAFLHLIAWDDTNGGIAGVARIVVNVGPAVQLASQSWTQGTSLSVDVYAACNAGMLTTDGTTKAKTIVVTGLPAGLSYSDTTGLITGTPTTATSGSLSITVTNSVGQSVSASVGYTVAAASAGVAAPTGISSATLVASYDPNDAPSVSASGGVISAIAQSSIDTATYGLSAATMTATNSPTIVSRAGKNVISLVAASLQYLQNATTLGVNSQPVTAVVVYEPATVPGAGTAHAVLDICEPSQGLPVNRQTLIGSPASGWSWRKCDAAGNSSTAQTGGSITTGIRLLVGRSPSGAGQAAKLNVDGQGSAIVAGVTSSGPTMPIGKTTIGVSMETGTPSSVRYCNGYVFRVLVYSGLMSDADAEAVAVWAASNYGTTNAA